MKKKSIVLAMLSTIIFSITAAYAATTPSLGVSSTFSILSSTYTNTVSGTIINGDVGYTTPPAMMPTINGITNVANLIYNQAGIDQNAALSSINGQLCTFTFAPGAIDLATDATHGTIGVYTPGVYCTLGAATIGSAGITLDGTGTIIFKITGALNTSANSSVKAIKGASACNTFWTVTQATTLAANTTFLGTLIDPAGITIGANSIWNGQALAFGGTVTTDKTMITTLACPTTPVVIPPVNSGGGGGGNSTVDYCVNGDYSPSYYDNLCGTAPIIVATGSTSATGIVNTVSTGTLIPVTVTNTGVTVPEVQLPTATIIETIVPISVISTPVKRPAPGLPNTGLADIEESSNSNFNFVIIFAIISAMATLLILGPKMRKQKN